MFLRIGMNRAFTLIFLVLLPLFSLASELNENNGPSEYIHQTLHRAVEVYVVRYDSVVKSTWADGAGDRIDVSATIIDGVKGSRATGDKINFFRILDGRYKDTNEFVGQLFIIFYEKTENGININPQDPSAVTAHCVEKLKYLQDHETET
jgi:hypothetical protein